MNWIEKNSIHFHNFDTKSVGRPYLSREIPKGPLN